MRKVGFGFLFFIAMNFSMGLFLSAQEIKCIDCHENLILNTVHDKIIKCGDCHDDIRSEEHSKANIKKVDCKKCHAALNTQMNNDVHRKLKHLSEAKSPNCKSCHGTHNIISPTTIKDKEKTYCGKCHKTNIMATAYHTVSNTNESCAKCHNKKDHKLELSKSIHKNLSCANCHSYVVNNMANHKKAPKDGVLADCYLCHSAIAKEHKESIHGLSLTEGINEAAQCWNCHGSHDISPINTIESKVYPINLPATCGKCHDDTTFIKKYSLSANKPGKTYSESVHGKLVMSGKKNSATCVTCHGKHDIKNRVQYASMISSVNLPNTCEKCHKEITEDYKKSIHWIAVKKGIRSAPSCNDCHSEHNIQAINTINKRDKMKKIQDNTCLQCHQNLLLSQRYGMENMNVKSYQDSYHGLASSHGNKNAAMCVDCHSVHKILPKDHPESSTNKNNILKTCKKCHTEATETFANSYSHTTQVGSAANIESIVRKVYFWLIVVVIGWMFFHNLLILIHEIRNRYNKSKNEIRIPRFTKNELIQHTMLLSSFILLAITGFLLKFPDSILGDLFYSLGLTEIIRQWIHRISALVMIVLSVYHVIYLIFTSRGRDVLFGLFPNFSDLIQMKDTMLYYLHLSKKHPEYDNYNYIEKMEYWALIWGTVIMGLTGFVLWFPTIVGNWAPVWFIKVSEIVHFYEAILATLAIVVWHWFFVMFRPNEYPVSFTVFDGKMTVSHYKEEHRLKYYKVIQEFMEMEKGNLSAKKASHFTKLFIDTIEKQGITMQEFVNNELINDAKLREFINSNN
ncbi:MAG: cytochrome c3 family protein [Bacteroidetes bacterium]|nr:cytochrome c3 family protein [Bacteroidota bacterium]